ncbi:MAG: hypothetical protein RIC52_01735, partial [Amphiplicatus sp.]
MAGQPDLAAACAGKLFAQDKMRATWNLLARLEFKPVGKAPSDGDSLDGARKAIAGTRLGADKLGVCLAKSLAQFCHGVGEDVLNGDAAGPYRLQQLFLGDDLVSMTQQHRQDFERTAFQ